MCFQAGACSKDLLLALNRLLQSLCKHGWVQLSSTTWCHFKYWFSHPICLTSLIRCCRLLSSVWNLFSSAEWIKASGFILPLMPMDATDKKTGCHSHRDRRLLFSLSCILVVLSKTVWDVQPESTTISYARPLTLPRAVTITCVSWPNRAWRPRSGWTHLVDKDQNTSWKREPQVWRNASSLCSS